MATIMWTGAAGDGNFNNPSNWSPQQVPGSADTAVISETAATSIAVGNDTLGGLTTSKLVTLSLGDNANFTIGSGSGTATFANSGTFALNGSYYGDTLFVGGKQLTLSGSGTIAMGDFSGNRITAAAAGGVLDNVGNTIVGAGQLGEGTLTLVNATAGIIDAAGSNALVLNTGSAVTANAGLIEATTAGGGGLVINSAINNGTAGRITAAGGNVYLQGATLQGGTLSSTGTSAIIDNGGATLDGSAHTVVNKGLLTVTDQNNLTLLGTLTNQGTLAMQSTYYGDTLFVGSTTGTLAGTVTLTGGGALTMTDHPNNRISAGLAGAKLINLNNTISGGGQIGEGSTLTVVNNGTIDANANNALYLNPVGTVTNNGLLESTLGTGSGLIITTRVDSSGGGTILSAGGNVYLQGGTLAGGTIRSSGGGAVVVNGGGTLDGSSQAVSNAGLVTITDQNTLDLVGTIVNTGTIALQSTYYGANLVATGSTVTLTGGGTISTTDHPNNHIYGATAGTVLDNVNNLITGSGQLGDGMLTLINEAAGVIDASSAGNALVLGAGSAAITNSGLIEATGAGGLLIQNVTVNDTSSGTIEVNGGNVSLQGAIVQGGTLAVAGTGGIFIDNGGATLDGSVKAVTSLGSLIVTDNNQLTLLGTVNNKGTLSLQSTYYGATLNVGPSSGAAGTVTLTGGGMLTTTDHPNNVIQAAEAGNTLVNVNNTITMAGRLGNGTDLNVVNNATIDANGTNALTINSTGTFANNKLLEATGTGGLVINTIVDSSGGGTVMAAGGNVYLQGGTLSGGIVGSSGGGEVVVNGGGTLNGAAHSLTNLGTIAVTDNNSLNLLGTIVNTGTIALQSTYYGANLIIDTPMVTLSGGGTVTMTDHPNNRIYGAATGDVLNNVNNTIEGAGQLGYGQLTLVNGGTIAATGGNALYVNLGSTGLNTASGRMLGEGSGGLIFQNGTYTNQGLIQADSGSSVVFQSGAVLTNDSAAGVLAGGTYGAVSAGGTSTAVASFTGAAVVTDDAAIVLSGTGSEISFGGTTIEASLKTIGKGASLSVLGGRGYTTKNKISNSGTLALAGGVFKASALDDKSTALLTGHGTVAAKLTDDGAIVATGGELDLTGKTNTIAGTISGTGTLGFGGTTTLNTGTVLDVGSIALLNKATLNIAAPVSFAGTFDITGTATLAGVATFTNTGLFEATGKGVGTISDPFANGGTISVAAGTSLAFSGGLANTGLILDSGTFSDTAALTGGSLTIGGTSSAAIIASVAGAANSTLATLTTAGGALNTSGTKLTVTGDYINTASGSGNSYNPFAGVTGTIDGNGTKLTVVGVNGTTISTVHGTLTIAVQAGHTASFEIENTGAAGSAALRGALQTTVNGGSITGTALSGSGVAAGDFGPIAAGAASGIYKIAYSGGTLTNEAIHIASDFANVAGLTIDIVAQAGTMVASVPAVLSAGHPDAVHAVLGWLPGYHQN